jgi:hypothetical protein
MSKNIDTKNIDLNLEDFDFEEIRNPDPVIKEQLCEPNYNKNYNTEHDDHEVSNFVSATDDDINKILKQSLEEFEFAEEQQIKELIAAERSSRVEKYNVIKQKLQKVQGFDTANKGIYNIIITIFELYESNLIDTYALEQNDYANVFKLLQTIRLTKEEQGLIHDLIYPPFYKR